MEADKSQDLQGGLASWTPMRTNGMVPIQRLAGSGPRKSSCFGSKAVREKEFSLICGKVSPLVRVRPSTDYVRPTCTRESNLLY